MGRMFIWLLVIEVQMHGACVSSALEDSVADGRGEERVRGWGEQYFFRGRRVVVGQPFSFYNNFLR